MANFSVVALGNMIKDRFDEYDSGKITDVECVIKCKAFINDWLTVEKEELTKKLSILNHYDDDNY